MQRVNKARLNFLVNAERKVIVIRPIGDMPAASLIDQLFEAYGRVDAPWTYNRLTDFRRYEWFLGEKDICEIAQRWKSLAGGRDYHACVAVVSHDHLDKARVPAISPMFPNETMCHFTDFHDAMGWLTATDKARYLRSVTPKAQVRREDTRITVHETGTS